MSTRQDRGLICVDGRMIGTAGGTGITTYSETVVAALCANGADPRVLRAVARDGHWRRRWAAVRRGARPVAATEDGYLGYDIFREAQVHFDLYGRVMPLQIAGPAGVMHWTYPVPLMALGWRNLYTIHDLIPLTNPELTSIDGSRHGRLIRAVTAVADRVVTVSEASRRAILALPGMKPDRVDDCSQAVVVTRPARPIPPGLVQGRYFLFCGLIEPRKNLVRLAEAYRRSGADWPLVLAGPAGWCGTAVRTMIDGGKDAASAGRIIWQPYLPRDELLALLAGAGSLLFPSLAEGFGLPVVEAMALGVPVMTADRGALSEVSDGSASTVDVTDVDAMARCIARLCTDAVYRGDLSMRGRERAGAFGVKAFGSRLLQSYAKAIN